MSGYEPRWDVPPDWSRDLAYGDEGESLVADLYLGGVEVKHKRLGDLKFYIETRHNPGGRGFWKPSGISTTEAEQWAFVVADTEVVVFVPTRRILKAIELGWGYDVAETDGDNPTRGVLLSLNQLVSEWLDS